MSKEKTLTHKAPSNKIPLYVKMVATFQKNKKQYLPKAKSGISKFGMKKYYTIHDIISIINKLGYAASYTYSQSSLKMKEVGVGHLYIPEIDLNITLTDGVDFETFTLSAIGSNRQSPDFAMGSTISYAVRYFLGGLLGLSSSDLDPEQIEDRPSEYVMGNTPVEIPTSSLFKPQPTQKKLSVFRDATHPFTNRIRNTLKQFKWITREIYRFQANEADIDQIIKEEKEEEYIQTLTKKANGIKKLIDAEKYKKEELQKLFLVENLFKATPTTIKNKLNTKEA